MLCVCFSAVLICTQQCYLTAGGCSEGPCDMCLGHGAWLISTEPRLGAVFSTLGFWDYFPRIVIAAIRILYPTLFNLDRNWCMQCLISCCYNYEKQYIASINNKPLPI